MNDGLPYFSQWGSRQRNDHVVVRRTDPSTVEAVLRDIDSRYDWRSDGYSSRAEYLFWSRKLCGLACLQSLLHGWTDTRLSMGALLTLALDRGCYTVEPSGKVHGLFYRPFMAWIDAQFGFRCELVERTTIEVSARRIGPGRVMIASVSPEIREPATKNPLRGGHLVLIHAVHDGVVRFHDPSGYTSNSESASLPIPVFERFHADRGIVISSRETAESAAAEPIRRASSCPVCAHRACFDSAWPKGMQVASARHSGD
ncbi:hypothetical protein [Nocardia wallacei]|uniref:hypothetical protein n=2 Tax=Nocardia wallacei TaxID=480035 RepID=UPI0024569DB8|nr:hypothetical protein [Nocardia wallacei]